MSEGRLRGNVKRKGKDRRNTCLEQIMDGVSRKRSSGYGKQ